MALKVATTHPLLSLVILVASVIAVCADKATCVNEVRPANKKACENQTFGQLIPYPGNCSKFLVCNCENPTVKHCPAGTWFDNELKVCNYPQHVHCVDIEGTEVTTQYFKTTSFTKGNLDPWEKSKDCKDPPGMSSEICLTNKQEVLLKYPFNCNAYINCTEGCPVMSYCPADKVFNDLLKICDTPDTAQCKELPLPTSTTSLDTLPNTNVPSTSPTSLATVEPSTELTTSQADFCLIPLGVDAYVCSKNFQDVYLFYPYNCSAYIKCEGDMPCLQYCEKGKIFNADLGICDQDIECQETSFITTTIPFSTTGVSSSLPPLVDPGLCQNEKDYTVFPYNENCRNYLLCDNGEVKFERCPDGWLFNTKLMLCDESADDQCSGIVSPATENPTTTTTSAGTENEPCLNQPAGSTFPNKKNCQLYYYCRGNGLHYMISCPFKNFYNPKTGNCGPDVPALACHQTNTTTILSPQEKCANKMMGSTFTYEENCSKYIFCKGNGDFVIMNCPYKNYYYPNTGNCGPSDDQNICRKTAQNSHTTSIAETTTPIPELQICNNNYTGQLMPYPDNCKKYISCVRPIPIAFDCPNNGQFNNKQQKCVMNTAGALTNITNDICQDHKEGSLQVNVDNCQLYYECLGNDSYMLKACNQGKYFDPVRRICSAYVGAGSCWHYADNHPPTRQPKEICQDLVPGTKVNYPHNCSKYITCEQPIPQGSNCALGLQFSLEKQTCVEASESDCGTSTSTATVATTQIPLTTETFNQCTGKPDFTFLPYTNNCSLFILCYRHREHLAYCNTGEYFDKTLAMCSTRANEYSCLLNTTTEIPITTTPEPTFDTCYNKAEGTKIPYPNNCSKYIECHEPLNVGHDCSQGLEFSRQHQKCVLPELADCGTKQKTPTDSTSPQSTISVTAPPALETCENKPTGSTLAYTPDCSKYYVCIKGKEKLTYCMPNSYYNSLTGECDHNTSPHACTATSTTSTSTAMPTSEAAIISTTPAAEIAPSTCRNNKNGFMFADKQNCHQYFICFEESSVKCICANGLIFNPQQEECEDDMSNTGCPQLRTSTTESNEITQAESTTSSALATNTTEFTTPSPTTKSSKDNICCGQQHGIQLPYPGDQTKYVICQYPVPKVEVCAKGKLYSPSSSNCI